MTRRATERVAPVALLILLALPATVGAEDAVLRFLEARVQQDPLDFAAQSRLAARCVELLRETGDLSFLDRGMTAARASLAAVPAAQNPGGLAALAVVELESHRFAAARELARQACGIDPGDTSALATAGDAAFELGDAMAAAEAYALLAEHGESPAVLVRLARLAESRGEYRKALSLLRRTADAGAWYRVRLGELHLRSGRLAKAEHQYRLALKEQPDAYFALKRLAELLAGKGRFDEAIALYERLTARVPRADLIEAMRLAQENRVLREAPHAHPARPSSLGLPLRTRGAAE